MAKVVEGYVLDIDTAAGINAAPVTVYDANANTPLSGIVGLTTNPINTDANGHFKVTMDLSPGPIYVDAAIPGGSHERRMGLEQMQIGDHWMSDIPTLLHLFTDGVIRGVASELAVSVSGVSNQFTVATGEAIVQGYGWTLASGSYSQSIPANTTLPNRKSIVVLRQYTAGPYQGKQVIDLLLGVVDGVKPTLRQGTVVGSDTLWEFPLATLNTVQNAGVSTIDSDDRVFAQPQSQGFGRLTPTIYDEFGAVLTQFTAVPDGSGSAAQRAVSLDANHPGIWALATDGVNNHGVVLDGMFVLLPSVQSFEMEFQPSTGGTCIQRYGLYRAALSPLGTISDGVLVEFDNSGKSDTALTLRKYVANTATASGTLPLTANHWYRLTWTRTGPGAGTLRLDDLTAGTNVSAAFTGLSTTAVLQFAMGILAKTAAVYTILADWFAATLGPLTR